ncbi:tetratricopeptide repeat protein [Corynebacterium sp. CCM 9185]|uniref:Tetratricopeptide repeat protein n=1 Tax=Corynebacterium marambiense TaxID=2765364 RepID=A0ABS0VTV1_9CORY|nr:tetratricopeptide repeat protein [Corynebacterium marambiense]MBI9000211.1 tetratricopeptide repeat protein [Corynebacterium marambiense]MCK7663565.1 tetratricopeptide repeat protein [Corynebacterium marambiense]
MTTPERFTAGAVDLGEIKARAEARAQAQTHPPATGGGVPTSFVVTRENIEAEVIERSMQVPVVLLIGSDEVDSSRQLRADLTDLSAAAGHDWLFGYIDAQAAPELAQIFGVTALPTVIAIAGGRPLADFQGGQPQSALQEWTAAVVGACSGKLQGLPPQADAGERGDDAPGDPRFAPAEDAMEHGDFDAAIAVYDAILAKEPANTEAKLARDNARLLKRLAEADPAVDPVAAANADPSDIDKAFAAADAEVASGDPEPAFNRLVTLLASSQGEKKTAVKDRLLELFALFATDDPRVIAARGRMASALF